jgi:chromosome segregation ATPase
MPMPSANGIGIMDKEYGSSPSTKKSLDELKRQVTKLKAELESERSKLKQVHRDKTSELKRIQENYERERHKTIESVTKRLLNEHSVELRRIRESLSKEKDNELRQVLKFKDEELKAFKQQIHEEKDRAKRSEDDLKRHLTERTKGSSNEVENRLRDELSDQKEQRRKVEELYRLKCAADFEKAELIRRLKSEHEREVNELIRQSKREVAKEFHHLRSAEKALEEKNHELAFKDQLTRKLEAEKQEIRQRKTSLEFNISDSPLRSRIGSGTQESSLLESSPEADDVVSINVLFLLKVFQHVE